MCASLILVRFISIYI